MLLSSGFQMMRFSNHLIDFIWGHSSFSSLPSMRGATPAGDPMQATEFHLRRQDFTDVPHLLAATGGLQITAFRYPTGIEALQLDNRHGRIVILPFMGQMIWSVEFNGVDLTMGSRFAMPRPAGSIVETYGCFAFHSGMLRNGCPSPQDNHPCMVKCPVPPWTRPVLSSVTTRAAPMFG